MNKITGYGSTPLNRRERKWYPNHEGIYQNKITNPVLLRFFNEPSNYPKTYWPAWKDISQYFPVENQISDADMVEAENINDRELIQ